MAVLKSRDNVLFSKTNESAVAPLINILWPFKDDLFFAKKTHTMVIKVLNNDIWVGN